MPADIHHAFVKAKTFDNINTPLLINIKRHRVSQQRLGRHEADLQSGRHLEAFHCHRTLIGCRLYIHAFGWLEVRAIHGAAQNDSHRQQDFFHNGGHHTQRAILRK